MLGNLVLRQRQWRSHKEYVHFVRQSFDDNNETCEMVYGSAAIHPHYLGLLMMRGMSSSGKIGQAK
jgi:hypothetical protein